MNSWHVAFMVVISLAPTSAFAQVGAQTAVEGYVFDVETKKPLANAIVRLTSADPNDSNSVQIAATSTNASGFFAIPMVIDPASRNTVTAECSTKRGIISADLPLYTPARATIYRRDFYLSLPKRATRCVLP